MLFQVSPHAVEQYLDRLLGLKIPYTEDQLRLGRERLEELVKDATGISKTDFVRPIPYVETEVWSGRDVSGTKVYLFVDNDEVITILRDIDYTQRYRIVDGERRLVPQRGQPQQDRLRVPKCPTSTGHAHSRKRRTSGR